MAEYQQLTPDLLARGRYKVREPFRISDDVDYTCIAIRSFRDIYREGSNPYTTIYQPVGLVDGFVIGDMTFSFAREELRGINIVTLMDDAGQSYLIPDNYIASFPSSTTVQYREFILSCSLGPLPEDIDTVAAELAVASAVSEQFGIEPTVAVHSLATLTNPTYEEHLALEQARKAAINTGSGQTERVKELEENALRDREIIATLTQILVDNNLLPST